MSDKEKWSVEVYHKDSHCTYRFTDIVSVHEEGSYTVLFRDDGVIYKYPTTTIWRLKMAKEEK
jgi:hypothetical protein